MALGALLMILGMVAMGGGDMVERIHERNDLWIFLNRLKRISLFKQALTSEQQAELAAFIAARNE